MNLLAVVLAARLGALAADGPPQILARPNPFKASTEILLQNTWGGKAKLAIFDMRGRPIRTVTPWTTIRTGTYATFWDGRDDSGMLVPSGGYVLAWYRKSGLYPKQTPDLFSTLKMRIVR